MESEGIYPICLSYILNQIVMNHIYRKVDNDGTLWREFEIGKKLGIMQLQPSIIEIEEHQISSVIL